MITFLKNELEKFKKILQKENMQYFVNDFNENRSGIKDAALDLSLCFLREMKQDEAADTLERKRPTSVRLSFIDVKENINIKNICIVVFSVFRAVFHSSAEM